MGARWRWVVGTLPYLTWCWRVSAAGAPVVYLMRGRQSYSSEAGTKQTWSYLEQIYFKKNIIHHAEFPTCNTVKLWEGNEDARRKVWCTCRGGGGQESRLPFLTLLLWQISKLKTFCISCSWLYINACWYLYTLCFYFKVLPPHTLDSAFTFLELP